MNKTFVPYDEFERRAQTGDIFRTVFASMGYKEIGLLTDFAVSYGIIGSGYERRCFMSPGCAECGAFILGASSAEADAEVIAAAIEAALAAGIGDFSVKIRVGAADTGLLQKISELCSEDELAAIIAAMPLEKEAAAKLLHAVKTLRLLTLYGLEEYIGVDGDADAPDFYGTDGDTVIMTGTKRDGMCGFVFDMEKCARPQESAPEASVIFAEKDAQGLAYELAYTLRVNGCLVEGYIGGGDFADCERYCADTNAACMLRVFADGTVKIKDFLKNEITETTVDEFLGYYGHGDDCGCGHHHGEDCDCGHHHDDCGHHHGGECGCDE